MAIPPKIWYYGTTKIEAQKIVKGDHSAFEGGGGALNTKRKEGRHTTVAVELLKLETGGFVADTPGIRGLSLLDVGARVMDGYFPEIGQIREDCERNPCTHLREAGCAVRAAVGEGRIAESRYNSYCELRKQARD